MTPDEMTHDELTAIEQRARRATDLAEDGDIARDGAHGGGRLSLRPRGSAGRMRIADFYHGPDCEFYVLAREDVLSLCAEVKRLTAELAAAKAESVRLGAITGS